ncbi:pilus assembly PilX family protein [Luteimonas notoginsengisoli]|jgi:type IV pilus assembly protein PilX|uniref:PilX N-terminal domain-containing pilus assembly protein n=1 Tax=Luteimonas notoginsengisoli TaxID=1578200 RepID=A0ABV7URP5_9GAMM
MNAIDRIALRPRRRQAGISLLVVLILLLVTSVLGIAVLRSSAMQERMSGNMYDRSLAMQAAELGLSAGQQALNAAPKWQDTVPAVNDCNVSSVCPTFTKQGDATWSAGPILGQADPLVPDTRSDYWIEYLGINQSHMETGGTIPASDSVVTGPMFRVTARSQEKGRAQVILQNDVIYRFPRL